MKQDTTGFIRFEDRASDHGYWGAMEQKTGIRGPLTKRKKSYAKERCLLAEQSAKASHVERSTSITKRLVFQYPFCRKTNCNRIIERFLSRMIRGKAQAYDFFRLV
jgi:hypothetical protein